MPKENTLENVVQAIRNDLRDNASSFLKALQALVVYGHVNAEVVEKARTTMVQTLKSLGIEPIPEGPGGNWFGRSISYMGFEPREAAIVDLAIFGENRTIDEVQDHVFKHGFEKEREGQIRSSINAKSNRDVYFKVTANEAVSLTAKSRELAKRLKRRVGVT